MPSLAALTANAVVATGLGFTLYFRLIRTVGSMGTASTSYLKPTVGVLIGHVFLGEPLTGTLVMGMVAVLIGVAAINLPMLNRGRQAPSSETVLKDASSPML
jgi:drug/metabolite transporter (DMT)-like permease